MIKTGLLFCTILSCFSCNTHHKAEVIMLPETVVVTDSSYAQPTMENTKIRVVVSFISIGEGTDQEAGPMLETYIQQFKEKNAVLAINTKVLWGREGEIDNCFFLDNFNPDQQVSFIDGLRELFKGTKLIYINENQPYRLTK